MNRALWGLLFSAVLLGGCATTTQHHLALASVSGSHGTVHANHASIPQRPLDTLDESHGRSVDLSEQRVARGVPTPQPAREPVVFVLPVPQPPLPAPNIGAYTPNSRGN